jgi:hypothetical protein
VLSSLGWGGGFLLVRKARGTGCAGSLSACSAILCVFLPSSLFLPPNTDGLPPFLPALQHDTELAEYLLPLLPRAAFGAQNASGSTPLHWSALNGHLALAQALVLSPASAGDKLIDIKNEAGWTAVGEAERAERKEVAMWLVGRMILNDKTSDPEGASSTTASNSANIEGSAGAKEKGAADDDGDEEEEEVPLFKLTLDEKGEVIGHESLIGEQPQQPQQLQAEEPQPIAWGANRVSLCHPRDVLSSLHRVRCAAHVNRAILKRYEATTRLGHGARGRGGKAGRVDD